MNMLCIIFFWTFLSLVTGYEERFSSCKKQNQTYVDRIKDNESVVLTIPDRRTEFDKTWDQTCYWRFGNGSFHILFDIFNLHDSLNCSLEAIGIRFPGKMVYSHYLLLSMKSLVSWLNQNKSMKFCGKSYPKELELHYTKSDYFDIVHFWLPPSKTFFRLIMTKSDQHASEISQLDVSTTPMYLYSPGYPDKYYKNLNMEWILTAKDPKKRIMMEFLFLDIEDNTQCQNDFIQVKGDNTNFVTCGHKSKHVVALNDSSVNITFKTNGDEENEGFIIRYYTEPYPENRKSCVKEGLTLTALTFKPTKFAVTKNPSDKCCNWIIKANTPDHVVVFEVISYSMSSYPSKICNVMLMVKDTVEIGGSFQSIGMLNTPGYITGFCGKEFLRYYHSTNPTISVQLQDILGITINMTLSYYSVPLGLFNSNAAIPIGNRPSYINYNVHDVRSGNNSILLNAESGCIDISCRNLKIYGTFFKAYDGNSSEARYLEKSYHYGNSKISGSKKFMLLKLIRPIHYKLTRRRDSICLEIRSTDQCGRNFKKLVVPPSQVDIDIKYTATRAAISYVNITESGQSDVLTTNFHSDSPLSPSSQKEYTNVTIAGSIGVCVILVVGLSLVVFCIACKCKRNDRSRRTSLKMKHYPYHHLIQKLPIRDL